MTERQMLPGCPYAKKCGGCQLQNLSYPEQLKWKQAQVRRLLGKFHQVEPILGMENPYHYRNKVQAAFGVTRDRRIVSGIYQSSSHRIVPVDSCQIEDSKADAIIVTVRELLRSFKLTAYDERREQGVEMSILGEKVQLSHCGGQCEKCDHPSEECVPKALR